MPFRDVLGHRRLLGVLARSVHHGSLPPSLIFAGPSGIGKRRVATALAQALNCTQIKISAASDPREIAANDLAVTSPPSTSLFAFLPAATPGADSKAVTAAAPGTLSEISRATASPRSTPTA